MTKKRIKVTKSVSLGAFDGSIDDVISRLQSWKDEGWEGIDVHYYYENTSYELYKHQLETDKEYEDRIKEEQRREYAQKEKRRIQYEQLKKEFSND